MSALPLKADMCSAVADVCFGPIADMCSALALVSRGPQGTFVQHVAKRIAIPAMPSRPILRASHTHTGEKDTDRAQDKTDPDDNEQLSKQRVFDLSKYPEKQMAPSVKHRQRNENVDGQGHHQIVTQPANA